MKAISKISIGLIAAAVLIVGCNDGVKSASQTSVKPTITEASLGLRTTDLYTENSTIPIKTEYREAGAGSSTKIKRAFQDAPPLIPHDTTGMLPIKVGSNQCIGCHMPDVAAAMGATPIPVSHFTNFRPSNKIVDGKFEKALNNYKNQVLITKTSHLQNSRFNCSQCHARQSEGNANENTFQAVFTAPNGSKRSSWSGKAFTTGLKTIHDGKSYVTKEDVENKNSEAGKSIWTHH